jgi:transcriptional regulator with XRE-family HTH domain
MDNPEMKIDVTRIREEREKRAWTQEQLAEVAGLGVRTVQRIEATGTASFESAASLSSALSIPVNELRVARTIHVPETSLLRRLRANASAHIWRLLAALAIALILSPPRPVVLLTLWLSLCAAYLIGMAVASKRQSV